MGDGHDGQYAPLNLLNIDNGSVPEVFDAELRKVLDNINDPNCNPKAKREITLKLTLLPGEDREDMSYIVACTSKLAPVKPGINRAHLVRKQGQLHALTENVTQEKLFAAVQPPADSGVRNIAGAAS
jgi:hypothetical protein